MPVHTHIPVLEAEVVRALAPVAGGRYVDGTLGAGGHAAAILAASSPNGWLFGCDRDGEAVQAAATRLRKFEGRFEFRQANHAELAGWIPTASCDGVLLDLGLSSPQLERAERGFSFQRDGPLDMRMDVSQSLTAAKIVNETTMDDLASLFWRFGQERDARRYARAMVTERQRRPFETTRQLAELIEGLARRQGGRLHPATRVFQALRMAVNDEIESLQRGLEAAWTLLRPGARLAVISFHSLEDRSVKTFGRRLALPYTLPGEVDVPELRVPRAPQLKWVTRKAVVPCEAEKASNPRSRSARLRVMEKI